MSFNVNNTLLPDIPEEAKGYSNFLVVSSTTEDGKNYMLIGFSGNGLAVKSPEPLDPSMPDVYPYYLYLPKPVIVYEAIIDGAWVYDSEATGTGYQKFPLPLLTVEMDGSVFGFGIFWADHDIMEATLDSDQLPVSTESVYFPEYLLYNDVWLPRLPTSLSVSYPYTVVFKAEVKYSDAIKEILPELVDDTSYIAISFPNKTVCWHDDIENAYRVCDVNSYGQYQRIISGGKWSATEEIIGSNPVPVGSWSNDSGSSDVSAVWSNHNIYSYIVNDDGSMSNTGEIYFSGDGAITPPPLFSLTRTELGFCARKARKLAGVTGSLSVDAIFDAFANIEAFEDAERMVF